MLRCRAEILRAVEYDMAETRQQSRRDARQKQKTDKKIERVASGNEAVLRGLEYAPLRYKLRVCWIMLTNGRTRHLRPSLTDRVLGAIVRAFDAAGRVGNMDVREAWRRVCRRDR